MAATNVQAFPGDVTISSNLVVDTNTLFIDSVNDRVGIGTTTPEAKLHVKASGTGNPGTNGIIVFNPTDGSGDAIIAARVYGTGGDPYLSFDVTGVAGWAFGVDSSDSNKLKWSSNWDSLSAATKMTLDTSGKLGIGTDAPTRKLHVSGDGQTATGGLIHAHLDETGGAPYESNAFSMNMGGYSHSIRMDLNTLSLNAYGDAGRYGAMKFVVGDGSGSGSGQLDAMTIGSGGNVGIGTNAPDYKLKIEQGLSNNSNGLFISNSNYGSMQGLNLSMVNAGDSYFYSYAAIQTYTSGVAAAATNLVLNPTAGNVGIGTNDPKSTLEVYKLATANDAPGGGILMSRYKNGDSDMRTSAIFSMGYQGTDSIIFKSSSTTTAFSSALPYMRLVTVTLTPRLEIVQAANGGIKYSNTFIQSSGSIGRHYETDAGASLGSSIHFSGGTLYPADYAGSINNGVINFGASGNRWNVIYATKGDYSGEGPIINCTTNNPGDMISKRYASADRYGMGQYSGGATRIFTSTAYTTASVRISGATDDVLTGAATFTDFATFLTNGNVGIGTNDPAVRLDFGSPATNRIINLYGSGGDSATTNYYGFGINAYTLRYNVSGTAEVHRFYGDTTEFGYVDNGTGFVSTFTGQHKSFPHETLSGKSVDELSGLIVCASGEHISVNDAIPQRGQDGITVSEAVPIVCLSSYMNEKTVFGVVSNVEDPEDTQRNDRNGAFTSTFKKIVGDTRIYVNSLGEGAVWVCNTNGSLVNGDYITTSNVAGYGQKQDSDTLKNYTVAKITMDCDFRGTLVPKKQIKKKFVTETLQETVEEEYEDNMAEDVYTYDVDRECYVKTVKDNIKTQTRSVMQEYELRDSDGNVITETISKTISTKEYEILVNKEGCVANISGYQNEDGTITVEEYSTLEDRTGYSEIIDNYTQTINQPVTYSGKKIIVKTVTHEVDDLDEHGNLQWEDHPTETETAYKIRYLDADGNITDEANHVYKAAFVGCTYHCG